MAIINCVDTSGLRNSSVLTEFAKSAEPLERQGVAGNSHTPLPIVLDLFDNDSVASVRKAAERNINNRYLHIGGGILAIGALPERIAAARAAVTRHPSPTEWVAF